MTLLSPPVFDAKTLNIKFEPLSPLPPMPLIVEPPAEPKASKSKKPPELTFEEKLSKKAWLAECDYKLILTQADWEAFKATITDTMVVDVETQGLNRYKHHVVGIAMSAGEKSGIYIPLKHVVNNYQDDIEWLLGDIQEVFKKTTVLMYNAKFDIDFLEKMGLTTPLYEDVIISVYLNNTNNPNKKLKDTITKQFQIDMIKLDEFFDKKDKDRNFSLVDPLKAVPYACADADMTFRLHNLFAADREEQGVIYKVENKLVDVIRRMENNRVRVDADYLSRIPEDVEKHLKRYEKLIYGYAGKEFDILSPQQLCEVLLGMGFTLDPNIPKKPVREGQVVKAPAQPWKVDSVSLSKIKHPIAECVLNYRSYNKTLGTYIIHLYKSAIEVGEARFRYNQLAAATGRFSSGLDKSRDSDQGRPSKTNVVDDGYTPVNAQNIPSVNEDQWLKVHRIQKRHLKTSGQLLFEDKPRTLDIDKWEEKMEMLPANID